MFGILYLCILYFWILDLGIRDLGILDLFIVVVVFLFFVFCCFLFLEEPIAERRAPNPGVLARQPLRGRLEKTLKGGRRESPRKGRFLSPCLLVPSGLREAAG